MNNKIIKIPYDKKTEEKIRQAFWKSRHCYITPKHRKVSLEKLAKLENRNESKVISDGEKFVKELFSSLSFEVMIYDLPKREKEAISLRADGFSREKIAQELGVKENAIKQRLFRAYKKIKEKKERIPKKSKGNKCPIKNLQKN